MRSSDLRASFLSFFASREHLRIPSSSLVPESDPSLLFTNAGMVQFKNVFLGLEPAPAPRVASCQRCLRAGGKHNDLDNVGRTTRHHTFFEMLGNFSFGDYFKEEAVRYAWEYLTKVLELSAERLWVTVHERDPETERIWLERVGFPAARLRRAGQDNFWAMADTGPCGPCTEIYYDHGPALPGTPPGAGHEGDRYVELWNIVFTQYNRTTAGELSPITRPAVDTGMGLERIAAVLQGVYDNYATDVLSRLLEAARALAPRPEADPVAVRVIADHARAAAFLAADGVRPGNEGRAYVLRRIIRRALRFGSRIGLREPFLHRLLEPLREAMESAYPELEQQLEPVRATLRDEEERFLLTLEQGLRRLDKILEQARDGVVPGPEVFRLYDTYGFPPDLAADAAAERGLRIDEPGFERAMREQRERARGASRFEARAVPAEADAGPASEFVGYDTLRCAARVLVLRRNGAAVPALADGEEGGVILDRTPFYAEGGGQVGDQGLLRGDDGLRFEVDDTRKCGDSYLHLGRLAGGKLHPGMCLAAEVNKAARRATARNHSATHLLHAALRELLGGHVTQQGSLVTPQRLRFDFSHSAPLDAAQLRELERHVNERALDNAATEIRQMSYAQAVEAGALTLGGEKYGGRVRVLGIGGGYSLELCGGTHVSRAGDIGLFKITGQSAVASGVRRLEAVTGLEALSRLQSEEERLAELARRLGGEPRSLDARLDKLLERTRGLEKQLEGARARLVADLERRLAGAAREVSGFQVVAEVLEEADAGLLRLTAERLKGSLASGVIALAAVEGDKVGWATGIGPRGTELLHAGNLAQHLAGLLGGRGGGRPDLGQGGGGDPVALREALASVPAWVRGQAVTPAKEPDR